MLKSIVAAFSVALIVGTPVYAGGKPHNAKITVIFDHKLPNVPGKSMRGVLVEYGPGGSNPSHTHAKSAFISATVIQGRIKSQVNDGKLKIYETGENWIEVPGDHHLVSANASDTEDAKILAVFVVDTNDAELTTPDH
ncbi:cupin domain-containing protein [Ensifer sp. ENS07]|uniref:cupin domain-containing protein n=1 Tax=unclassified Ensifer TaxID=2633371 RepID=UPI0017872AB5|nr:MULTISPECIES: cupin domain-containing protein [unclassified Ensifer]MBD9508052.1 cupin domain-containing protein [Ensifer sp. ENS10]MBD9637452.1 cupin domain-containing protein [Ensifer sp. ENS07]